MRHEARPSEQCTGMRWRPGLRLASTPFGVCSWRVTWSAQCVLTVNQMRRGHSVAKCEGCLEDFGPANNGCHCSLLRHEKGTSKHTAALLCAITR